MNRIQVFAALIGVLTVTSASATSIAVTLDSITKGIKGTSNATSDVTSSGSGKDHKVILAAKDDAASFVATSGGIRGAQLEQALLDIRAQDAALQATDMEIAAAIIVFK
ncbi:MAG: hypothetical protein JWP80_3749 [Pseudomonas sp.]|nr:hypothetical protein [Pseudomonas sp.]